LPANLTARLLKEGQLRHVLAPWITHRLSLVAVLPSRKFMPARVRAFLDHLIDYAQNAVAGLDLAP
jgi:DNA-binding transcriptional LysR family regulator